MHPEDVEGPACSYVAPSTGAYVPTHTPGLAQTQDTPVPGFLLYYGTILLHYGQRDGYGCAHILPPVLMADVVHS